MQVLVGDERLSAYLARVEGAMPRDVVLVGIGRDVGKACWLGLVLERELCYHQKRVSLDCVAGSGDADLARITISLEGKENGGATQSHSA